MTDTDTSADTVERLEDCPFCGSDDLDSGGDDKVVGYWCRNCQATGPNHYGRYEWNDRANADDLRALLAERDQLQAQVEKADQLVEALDRDWSDASWSEWEELKSALAAYRKARGETND